MHRIRLARALVDHVEQLAIEEDAERHQAGHGLEADDRPARREADGVTIGNDGSVCDNGNFCTAGEKCAPGQCVGGLPSNNRVACDDQNGCTGGTTRANGTCSGPTSQITTCSSGDACCPVGCALNTDADCLYWQSGVQQNVAEATLQGWTKCFTGTSFRAVRPAFRVPGEELQSNRGGRLRHPWWICTLGTSRWSSELDTAARCPSWSSPRRSTLPVEPGRSALQGGWRSRSGSTSSSGRCGHTFVRERQSDVEGAPAALLAFEPHLAAMARHDRS